MKNKAEDAQPELDEKVKAAIMQKAQSGGAIRKTRKKKAEKPDEKVGEAIAATMQGGAISRKVKKKKKAGLLPRYWCNCSSY